VADLLALARLATRMEKAVDEAASDAAKQVAVTLVGELAYTTPVDTSKALSNWQAALGAPNSPQIKPHFPGEKGSTQKASAEQTIAACETGSGRQKAGAINFHFE
jgi:hypothetical protein